MRVMVIGANGQLGSDVCDEFEGAGHAVIPATHEDGDIGDYEAMERLFQKSEPDLVINTAAMHNVEACEKSPEEAYRVNAIGTGNLARLCSNINAPFIHISTDYVHDGKKAAPYVEDDAARPLNAYGNTKLAGENYAIAAWDKTAIVRVGGIYGKNPCRAKNGLNFVQLMLKLAREKPEIRVVDDEIVTPTSTVAIARQLVKIAENGVYGVIHATCQGQCSWHEFAKAIFETTGVGANLQKATPGEFPMKVKRPLYSVLENKKLANAGIDIMPHWKEALRVYLADCLN